MEAERDIAWVDVVRNAIVIQKVVERMPNDQDMHIHISVMNAVGLVVASKPATAENGKDFCHSSTAKVDMCDLFASKNPTVTLQMKPMEVKHRTGLESIELLLTYASVLCNGDANVAQ